MLKIGNVEIKNKLVLAPMAGICDNAFRTIVKEHGAGLIYTEMVSEKAVYYKNEKTLKMLYVSDDEKPVSLQVFGSDVETFVEAVRFIDKNSNCDIIDINMGCPVPKVATRGGSGAALLKNPELVKNIITEVVKVSSKPITVKIRTGWDSSSINCIEIAKIAEKAGAAAIAVHGRTRKQMYSGCADLDLIKKVKEAVNIPVIGNGDIVDVESAQKMLDTGVDAVMIGRGCLGNPFIFEELNCYIENKPYTPLTIEKRMEVALDHLERLVMLKGEKIAVSEMRSQMHYYLKGLPNSSVVKIAVNKTRTKQDYNDLIKEYLNSI
ncbi:MAG: tRNA dihydrouridine synthase DusB [Bacilli bacterium]